MRDKVAEMTTETLRATCDTLRYTIAHVCATLTGRLRSTLRRKHKRVTKIRRNEGQLDNYNATLIPFAPLPDKM